MSGLSAAVETNVKRAPTSCMLNPRFVTRPYAVLRGVVSYPTNHIEKKVSDVHSPYVDGTTDVVGQRTRLVR